MDVKKLEGEMKKSERAIKTARNREVRKLEGLFVDQGMAHGYFRYRGVDFMQLNRIFWDDLSDEFMVLLLDSDEAKPYVMQAGQQTWRLDAFLLALEEESLVQVSVP
jgi:hypothetical protein